MDYLYILNWISENNAIVFVALNIITISLVIFGWCIVFSQNKKLMKNKAQMKIYEELYELRKLFLQIKSLKQLKQKNEKRISININNKINYSG